MIKTVYKYCVFNEVKNSLVEYSGYFNSEDEAKAWYNKHGIELEKMFNRKLILV